MQQNQWSAQVTCMASVLACSAASSVSFDGNQVRLRGYLLHGKMRLVAHSLGAGPNEFLKLFHVTPSSSKWTCGIVLISRRGNHLVHASTDVTGPSKFMRAIRKRRPEAHTISCGMGWRLLIESTGTLMGPCAAQQCDHLLS